MPPIQGAKKAGEIQHLTGLFLAAGARNYAGFDCFQTASAI